jgi:prepilin-type N-terminal cleavage/methylation domain-containing protein
VTEQRGFTLIELMVALAITSIVALLGHQIVTVATRGAQDLRRAGYDLDRQGNAKRWLALTLGSLEVGQPGDNPFEGRPAELRCTAWVETSLGWMERTNVRLTVAGGHLVASTDGLGAISLSDSSAAVAFDYLLVPGADSRWIGDWSSPTTAPVAVRIRLSRVIDSTMARRVDTLLFLVKARG